MGTVCGVDKKTKTNVKTNNLTKENL